MPLGSRSLFVASLEGLWEAERLYQMRQRILVAPLKCTPLSPRPWAAELTLPVVEDRLRQSEDVDEERHGSWHVKVACDDCQSFPPGGNHVGRQSEVGIADGVVRCRFLENALWIDAQVNEMRRQQCRLVHDMTIFV